MLRKIKLGGVILGALLALVGCQSEKLVNDGGSQGQQFTLTASKGMGGSRTAIINGQTVWSEGDKIYVSGDDGRVTGVLTLNPESIKDDPTRGTFTGFVFGDPEKLEYSVFPAPTNGTVIDLSTIVGGGEVDAPMIGAINPNPVDGTDVQFENVCGVAPIVMNGYQDKELVIQATNNGSAVKFLSKLDVTKVNLDSNPLSFITGTDETGTITITNPKGGEMYVPYYLKSTLDVNSEGKKIVEFKQGDKSLNKADLSNGFVGKVHASTVVAYTFKEDGSCVENKPTQPILNTENGKSTAVVDKNQFEAINNNQGEETPGETQYFNVSALVTKESTTEEGKTETIVAEAIEVTLPKVEAPTTEGEQPTEKSVEISFTNVTSSTTITIKEDSESTKPASIDNLTIVLPSGTTEEEAKEQVVIEMPNTTVTVKSADGNDLIINEMTASTAPNTLVVEKDVVIKKLNLQKGSLQVFGRIDHLVVSENKENVLYIIIEVGGRIGKITGNDGYQLIDKNKNEEIIIIPNPALSQYLYDNLGSDKVTINPNTQYAEMKKSDVVTVNEIVINNYDDDETDYTITSLVGIENFVNLTNLVCINVGLEEADLSQNLNLKDICCKDNENLASLILPEVEMSTIEVSNCSNLESLNIKYPNSIVTLDYSHTNVSFTYDQLAEFTSMKKLGCAGRFNGTLDIPNSIKENLETLICQNNALTELNLEEYPNLQVLECYWNELTLLNVSAAPNLVVLRCFANHMTELDITSLNNLKMLDCGNQQGEKTLNLLVSDTEDLARWEEHVNTRTDYNQDVEVCIVIKNHELSLAIWAEIQKGELSLPGQVYLNGDNWLVMSRDAVDAVTVLNFNSDENYTISSLSGIEHFTNLTRLVCEDTGLMEADLSSNTALTYLDVNFNGALSSLNINGLVNLTTLKYNETALTTLSIPEEAIPNIRVLEYGRQPYIDNPIAVYVPDVNKFTSLEQLTCYGQEFTLTNPAIKAQLIDLQCYMCNLSELDLTEYPNLVGLLCYANNLTELVIPENSQITSLYCYGNKLTTLDVTPLGDKLNYLWCGAQESELLLKLTESQKNRWNDPENGWYINADINNDGNGLNSNVELSVDGQQGGSDVTNGNTGGSGFTNGGIF